jgi:hypothetical protein
LPFSTKEPTVYQADIVVSFPVGPAGDAAAEQKYFVARDAETRRTDYELSDKDTLSVLEKPEGKTLALLQQKKCSTEDPGSSGISVQSQTGSLRESLTTGWLAEDIPANFADLGKEDVGEKQLAKYRVRFEKRGNVESQSEALVWVDPDMNMPVRTELYDLKDGQQLNKVSTEFRNLKLAVEPGVFDLPPGCQIIPAKEMQKILRQLRLSAE